MILMIRCHRESFIALNRTALLFPLSRRAKSDGISTADLKKYGNVYRVATKIPNPIDLIPKETQIHLRSAKIGFVHGETINDVRKRISTLNTGSPFPLIESRRIQGDWFDPTEEDKDEMDRVMKELDHTGNFTGDTRLLDKLKLEKEKRDELTEKGGVTQEKELYVNFFESVKNILRVQRMDLTNNRGFSTRRYLSHQDKNTVMEALENHPEASKKIGCGVETYRWKRRRL